MEANNIIQIENFVIECNDILSGKFFDLNRRLQKFLDVMSQSDDVMEFLADGLVGFDEDEELAKAFSLDRKTGAAKISFPNDEKKCAALFVTIFDKFANGKLNSTQFLQTFFQGGKMTPIQSFLDKIVKPFRDIICKTFEIPTDVTLFDVKKHEQEIALAKQKEEEIEEKEEKKQEELPHLSELLQEITKNCRQILAIINFEKKHYDFLDDVEFVTNAILKACEIGDLMIVNGLVIGLDSVAKKFKNAHHLIEDMKTLILNYYDFLADPQNFDDDVQSTEDFGGEDD